MTVDLARQVVVFPHGEAIGFEIEPLRRSAMLAGLDEIGLTLQHADAIAAYQAEDRAARPYVWQPGAGAWNWATCCGTHG